MLNIFPSHAYRDLAAERPIALVVEEVVSTHPEPTVRLLWARTVPHDPTCVERSFQQETDPEVLGELIRHHTPSDKDFVRILPLVSTTSSIRYLIATRTISSVEARDAFLRTYHKKRGGTQDALREALYTLTRQEGQALTAKDELLAALITHQRVKDLRPLLRLADGPYARRAALQRLKSLKANARDVTTHGIDSVIREIAWSTEERAELDNVLAVILEQDKGNIPKPRALTRAERVAVERAAERSEAEAMERLRSEALQHARSGDWNEALTIFQAMGPHPVKEKLAGDLLDLDPSTSDAITILPWVSANRYERFLRDHVDAQLSRSKVRAILTTKDHSTMFGSTQRGRFMRAHLEHVDLTADGAITNLYWEATPSEVSTLLDHYAQKDLIRPYKATLVKYAKTFEHLQHFDLHTISTSGSASAHLKTILTSIPKDELEIIATLGEHVPLQQAHQAARDVLH